MRNGFLPTRGSATGAAIVCAAIVALLLPAAASALTRYASPTGHDTTSDCTSQDPMNANGPCTLRRAFNDVAGGADEIVIGPGNYTVTDQLGQLAASAHGVPGQPAPVINTSANHAIVTSANTVLSDVRIEHTGNFSALTASGTVERVFVHTDAGAACRVENGSLIRDSVCWTEIGGGAGNGVFAGHGTNTISADIRNVTAAATGSGGKGIEVNTATGNISLEAKNTIALGAADPQGVDAVANAADAAGTATLAFEHSNYDSEDENGPGTATITNPGTGTGNQDAAVNPPLLANPIAGDFHQLASSPTVNAGGMVDMIGTADFEGDARIVDGVPDIGADEFVAAVNPPNPPNPPASDTTPPETEITKQPRNKSGRNRIVYRFTSEPGATFLCKLDRRPLAPCTSPFKKKVKDGKHRFSVQAADQAGNVDPTPDRDRFRVVG